MKTHIASDTWGWRDRIIAAALIALTILAFVGFMHGHAAPLDGQGGKCTRANEWRGLSCTVANSGVGWVYGDCAYGLSFSAETMRTFTPGQNVTIRGCKDQWGNIPNAKISR
jgi:hypothetical protein